MSTVLEQPDTLLGQLQRINGNTADLTKLQKTEANVAQIILNSSPNANQFVQVSPVKIIAKAAILQHIGQTLTEAVTVTVNYPGLPAVGTILNPPTTMGWAGGSISVANVDLSFFFFSRASTDVVTLSVLYLQ